MNNQSRQSTAQCDIFYNLLLQNWAITGWINFTEGCRGDHYLL